MKKLLGSLLIITMLLSLTACFGLGGKDGYVSSYTAYINRSDRNNSDLSKEEADTDKDMLNTYAHVFKSNAVLTKVCDSLSNSNYTVSQLEDMIYVEVEDNSYVIKVSVTADTPEKAYEIANAHARVSPEYIAQIIEGSSMKIINYPTLSEEKE